MPPALEPAAQATAEPGDPRAAAFGYTCRRCLRCCRDKIIRLNPYEIARLAAHRGQSTTAFRETSTADGAGLALDQTADGACVFLGPEGCQVHEDRPLACRLYPLGRYKSFSGEESFARTEIHPQSEGEWHARGDIAGFLRAQQAEPYIRAADRYSDWIASALTRLSDQTGQSRQDLLDGVRDAGDLLDMDATIARHCADTGAVAPADTEARTDLHLALLDQQLDAMGDEQDEIAEQDCG